MLFGSKTNEAIGKKQSIPYRRRMHEQKNSNGNEYDWFVFMRVVTKEIEKHKKQKIDKKWNEIYWTISNTYKFINI